MSSRAPFLLTCLVTGLLAWITPAAYGEMIRVGSHKLQVQSAGEGIPIVVIDAGLGDGIDKLAPFQERLARTTRVILYNRAGYGQSEPGPLPRDCGREAEEMKTMLENASVSGPLIVVGHSLGALNVQLFARKYPDRVAALVLLDPPPLSFIRREEYTDLLALADRMTSEWQAAADAGLGSTDPEMKARAGFLQMIASEHHSLFGDSARLVSEIESFGDLPLTVIAAGKPNPAFGEIAEEYQAYWVEQSRELSRKSSNARFILVGESAHHLYLDAPDIVEEAIVSLVRQVRGEK